MKRGMRRLREVPRRVHSSGKIRRRLSLSVRAENWIQYGRSVSRLDPAHVESSWPNPIENEYTSEISRYEYRIDEKQKIMRSSPPPPSPPIDDIYVSSYELLEKQKKNEEQVFEKACAEYKKMVQDLVRLGKGSELGPVQKALLSWYEPLTIRINQEKKDFINGIRSEDRSIYGPLLLLLKPEEFAVITLHNVLSSTMQASVHGVKYSALISTIGQEIMTEIRLNRLKQKEKENKKNKKYSFNLKALINSRSSKLVNIRTRKILSESDGLEWPRSTLAKLGSFLINELMQVATCPNTNEALFKHKIENTFKNGKVAKLGLVYISQPLLHESWIEEVMHHCAMPRYLPMVIPPRPWEDINRGCYLKLRPDLMRTNGNIDQIDAIRRAQMPKIYDGLNALAKVPWRINKEMLEIIDTAWHQAQCRFPEFPNFESIQEPQEPTEQIQELKNLTKIVTDDEIDPDHIHKLKQHCTNYYRRIRKIRKINTEQHSLRCDLLIKLKIAHDFKDDQAFYFPYNLDFRGRAYPIPPNLNHLGSDVCRSMLTFAEAKPLGTNGLYWLRVHLANLFGKSKSSLQERVQFTINNQQNIFASAQEPFQTNWWLEADEPWQALATCKEISAALNYPDGPENYKSSLPVHADGSCNGLQHYAALGRDHEGGKQVNLLPGDQPRDVYIGVCEKIVEKIDKITAGDTDILYEVFPDIDKDDDRKNNKIKMAHILDGIIDRKVVKQTVMTSVYGVTFIGARDQILKRLYDKVEEILAAPDNYAKKYAQLIQLDVIDAKTKELNEKELMKASQFAAALTLHVLSELFQSARKIMTWLGECASLISQAEQPVSWITPLDLPVVQPYRKDSAHVVRTLTQKINLFDNSTELPISTQKQKTAFPPNFIHSLDSTHMLLTAIEMDRRGLTFTAVHDSYWTHANDVPIMNTTLRSCFFELYSQPILEDLLDSFQIRYQHIDFPPIPERGKLNLAEVKQAPYFFS